MLCPEGAYELRARYYNPIMGRFISPDPMGFAGGQSNLLAYSFDAPTDYFDPLGLQSCRGTISDPGCPADGCASLLACQQAGASCRAGGGKGHKAPPILLRLSYPSSPTPFSGQPSNTCRTAQRPALSRAPPALLDAPN